MKGIRFVDTLQLQNKAGEKPLEEWKDVSEYVGMYQVSSLGRVKSLERRASDGRRLRERIMIGGFYPNGYRFVCLRKEGANKPIMVHRLVAKEFVPNPKNLPTVNHLDGKKDNNLAENLEWCTQGENLKHAIDIGVVKCQCKITRKCIVKRDEKIVAFETMKDCAAFFGFKKGWLQNRIRKHGCNFNYQGWFIEVHGRGIA